MVQVRDEENKYELSYLLMDSLRSFLRLSMTLPNRLLALAQRTSKGVHTLAQTVVTYPSLQDLEQVLQMGRKTV